MFKNQTCITEFSLNHFLVISTKSTLYGTEAWLLLLIKYFDNYVLLAEKVLEKMHVILPRVIYKPEKTDPIAFPKFL